LTFFVFFVRVPVVFDLEDAEVVLADDRNEAIVGASFTVKILLVESAYTQQLLIGSVCGNRSE
jgi:hypothetical protein